MEENTNEKSEQQNPNGLGQDEPITTTFNVWEFEKSVLSDTLREVTKEQGLGDYSFTKDVLDDFVEHVFEFERIIDFFDYLLCFGRDNVTMSPLSYDDDLKAFYSKHFEDIDLYVSKLEEQGEPMELYQPRYDFATWLVYEQVATRICHKVDFAYPKRLKDRLADLPTNLVKSVAWYCDLKDTEEVVEEELKRREKLSASQKQEQQPTTKKRGGRKL